MFREVIQLNCNQLIKSGDALMVYGMSLVIGYALRSCLLAFFTGGCSVFCKG